MFALFLFVIVMSVLRFTDSCGILTLFIYIVLLIQILDFRKYFKADRNGKAHECASRMRELYSVFRHEWNIFDNKKNQD